MGEVLHRGDPRRDDGHRKLQGAALRPPDERLLPVDARNRNACRDSDPDDKIILSKVYSSEGRWTFTSHTPGEHVICLYSNSTKWFSGSQLRVHLDIQVGEHAIDYANVAQKEKLSELQLRVRQLLDQVEQITKEQNYQRYREERFRQTSESTNQRVLWWALGQTCILLVMGAWRMQHSYPSCGTPPCCTYNNPNLIFKF